MTMMQLSTSIFRSRIGFDKSKMMMYVVRNITTKQIIQLQQLQQILRCVCTATSTCSNIISNRFATSSSLVSSSKRSMSVTSTVPPGTSNTAMTTTTTTTNAMIRTLYRDFIHYIKAQQQQQLQQVNSTSSSSSSSLLQQVRSEFRTPTLSSSSKGNYKTIDELYRYGTNRFSFLRMNATRNYKLRTYNHTTINNNTTTTSNTQRFVYKNGQRYELNNLRDGTVTAITDKGYTISPYNNTNLDPQSVSRHRANLKRAGFINNAHAKGIF